MQEVRQEKLASQLKLSNVTENVELLYDLQPFFYDKNQMFWRWVKEEYRYIQVDETDLLILVDNLLGNTGKIARTSIKKEYISMLKLFGRRKIPKEAPVKWIQFKDKAYSLKSSKIYDVTPAYFFTNPISWSLGESEHIPTINKLLTEWVGEENIDKAIELITYCCYRDYPLHIIPCLIGTGCNGKTQFVKLVTKFIGLGNICSTSLHSLTTNRFESSKLYKKLACMLGETEFGILEKTDLIKRLSGGEPIVGFEFKNKPPFDDKNYAKIIIATNGLPITMDSSTGFYRRIMVIDFPNTFSEGKEVYLDVPDVEFNNLAKKVINVLPKLLKKGEFSNQGSIEDRKRAYVMASNPLPYFIETYCFHNPDYYIRYSELYLAYIGFLKYSNRRMVSKPEFTKALDMEEIEVKRTTKTDKNGHYETDRWIVGYKLKSEKNYDSYAALSTSPVELLNTQSVIGKRAYVSYESLNEGQNSQHVANSDENLQHIKKNENLQHVKKNFKNLQHVKKSYDSDCKNYDTFMTAETFAKAGIVMTVMTHMPCFLCGEKETEFQTDNGRPLCKICAYCMIKQMG